MKIRSVRLLSVSAAILMTSTAAHAQATRTWVSGVGDDANPCSRTAPCKTFAGAISKTAPRGEINALDPAGYGAVTITKPITIDGGGEHASILSALVNGVIINITDLTNGGVVILRNLSINGAGTGINGIRFLAGTNLHVENVIVQKITNRGISFEPAATAELFVVNSTFSHGLQGIAVVPVGGITARASIERTNLVNNSGAGLSVQRGGVVSVRNSIATGNNSGFVINGVGGNAFLQLEDCGATHNTASGVFAGLGGGALTAFISMSNCLVSSNGTGVSADSTGIIRSWGNNKI